MTKLIEITGKAISGEWGTDDETGDGIPVLRTTNFTNHGAVDFTNVVTRNLGRKDLSGKFLRHGDIIIEKSGGSDTQPVGRVIFYDGPENTYLFNNFTGLLRVRDQQHWVPRYVFYALFANYCFGGTKPFENRTTGLHNLQTESYVDKTEIRETDVESQIAICSMLDRVKAVIDSRQRQLCTLDTLIKARFVEMFGDPVVNPMEWERAIMKSVCKKITDGEHGSVPREAAGHPFLNAKHIKQNGTIDWQTITYTSDEVHKRIYSRCNPEAGDILMTTTGTIGNVAIVPAVEEFSMDRGITLLKLNRTIVSPRFVAWLLRFDSMQMIMTANIHASAIGHLFLNKVEQLPVIVPPMQLQEQFAAFVSQVDKSKVVVQAALDKAQTLFDSLMQQYFG